MPTQPYLIDGVRVPGVTTVISGNLGWNKQQLMFWANKVGQEGKNHRDVSDEAASAGTLCHDMIECHIKGKEPNLKPYPIDIIATAQQGFDNYLHWANSMKFNPVLTEQNLVSKKYRFGGCPDCVAEINGQMAVFDWKTSSGVYADYLIQIAAYLNLLRENFDEEYPGGVYLLRISKETASWTLHHWQEDALGEAWEAFLLLRKLHDLKKNLEKLSK